MAVPSRTYVGLVVFGLIACLVTVPVAFLAWNGYCPPPGKPFEIGKPCDSPTPWGLRLFLVLACLFALTFTALAWRTLVRAARRDRLLLEQVRKQREGPRAPPPGYQ